MRSIPGEDAPFGIFEVQDCRKGLVCIFFPLAKATPKGTRKKRSHARPAGHEQRSTGALHLNVLVPANILEKPLS